MSSSVEARNSLSAVSILFLVCGPARSQIPASFIHVFQKRIELAGARGMAQLAQGFGFDLANALGVTANDSPTSSSVCSEPSSRPKRILTIFSSREVRV